jgi:hypothetical protein
LTVFDDLTIAVFVVLPVILSSLSSYCHAVSGGVATTVGCGAPGVLVERVVCGTAELELRFRLALLQMKVTQAKHPPVNTQKPMMIPKAIFDPVLIPGCVGGVG